MGGWLDQVGLKLTQSLAKAGVEVGTELGKKEFVLWFDNIIMYYSIHYIIIQYMGESTFDESCISVKGFMSIVYDTLTWHIEPFP